MPEGSVRQGASLLEVEYELTPDDLYAFQWRAAVTSPRARRFTRKVYGYWFLALLVVAVMPAIGAGGFVISRVDYKFFLITFAIIAALQWYLGRRLMRRAILQLLKEERPGRGQLGKHRVVLTDDGLLESTAVGESRTSWAGVNRVEHNAEYIFIYTSPAAAQVIPKRAFKGTQQAEAFYELSKIRKEATR
jgi:hypothetical protein